MKEIFAEDSYVRIQLGVRLPKTIKMCIRDSVQPSDFFTCAVDLHTLLQGHAQILIPVGTLNTNGPFLFSRRNQLHAPLRAGLLVFAGFPYLLSLIHI